MLNYLKSFLVNYQFPTECSNALVDAYNILEMKDKIKELARVVNLYKLEEEPQYEELALEVEKLSKDSSVHVYTLWLIVLILMSKTLHDRYRSLSYPDYIFDYSMLDIRYKAVECHLVKGIWGNFVSSWEYCFFKMNLFGFNSLQFEPIKLEKDYEADGNKVKQGESLLSVHIPRREKHLDEKEVERDFELAKEFFKDKVDHLFFYCHSWLLFPKNKEILSSSSHLRHFIDLFTLLDTYEAPNYSEMWRLFDMEIDENNLDSLPTNTSFRRGYVELMKNKEKTGGGVGIYIPKKL